MGFSVSFAKTLILIINKLLLSYLEDVKKIFRNSLQELSSITDKTAAVCQRHEKAFREQETNGEAQWELPHFLLNIFYPRVHFVQSVKTISLTSKEPWEMCYELQQCNHLARGTYNVLLLPSNRFWIYTPLTIRLGVLVVTHEGHT